MKKVLIIHGWEAGSKDHWYMEEKGILEKRAYLVEVPDMPNSANPILSEWLEVIENFSPDEESLLIGHSLGVPAILRYLEKSDNNVGIVILIAGFARDLGFEETRGFVRDPFDWDVIKNKADKFVVLNQKDDPWVKPGLGKEIADALGVEMTLIEGDNHFDTMDLDLINDNLSKA